MANPRPKILTALTVPDGGWSLKVYVDNAGSYDLAVTGTIPAGDYFVSGDSQSDDFLLAVMDAMYAALDACAAANYNGSDADGKLLVTMNEDHTISLAVGSDKSLDMRVAWTEEDGASIGAVLGFDTTADLDIEGDVASGTWQHAYGWYADEDGLAGSLPVQDTVEQLSAQSISPAGYVKTISFARRYTNAIGLRLLPRGKVFSGGKAYTESPVWPYEKNEPLECWWQEARQGVRFRVYLNNQITAALAEERGNASGGTSTTIVDASKSWDTDPQQFAGKLARVIMFEDAGNATIGFYVSSHTSTTITVPNDICNTAVASGMGYCVFDHRYGTYVLDAGSMPRFEASENADINRYSIEIPLLRYTA